MAKAGDRYVVTFNDVTYRKRGEEALKASREQLRELAARLQEAREEERAFIAREIHDELGQLLTGLKIDLKWFEKRLPQDAANADAVCCTPSTPPFKFPEWHASKIKIIWMPRCDRGERYLFKSRISNTSSFIPK